jgi:hypothetical protein
MYPDQKAMTVDKSSPYLQGFRRREPPDQAYVEMSFGMGKDAFRHQRRNTRQQMLPVARAKTGEYYRLPRRPNGNTRPAEHHGVFLGDDPALLGSAWNAKQRFQVSKSRSKETKPVETHDIYGNVVEWCIDQYDPEAYKKFQADPVPVLDPVDEALSACRPGRAHWDDDDVTCSVAPCAAPPTRVGSSRILEAPEKHWYLTDAQFLGFRLVRPLKVPYPGELLKMWNSEWNGSSSSSSRCFVVPAGDHARTG